MPAMNEDTTRKIVETLQTLGVGIFETTTHYWREMSAKEKDWEIEQLLNLCESALLDLNASKPDYSSVVASDDMPQQKFICVITLEDEVMASELIAMKEGKPEYKTVFDWAIEELEDIQDDETTYIINLFYPNGRMHNAYALDYDDEGNKGIRYF